MAHFAKIENGIVTRVNVVSQDRVNTYDGTWVQTSYNTRGKVIQTMMYSMHHSPTQVGL